MDAEYTPAAITTSARVMLRVLGAFALIVPALALDRKRVRHCDNTAE